MRASSARTSSASGPVSESLAEIEAVVASPIFDGETEVIGVVYGSRGRRARQLPTVGPLEAQVVQLLASTLGVGLARLQQETEAARMRVAKEMAEVALAKEMEYLRNVAVVTNAAAAVEAGRFGCLHHRLVGLFFENRDTVVERILESLDNLGFGGRLHIDRGRRDFRTEAAHLHHVGFRDVQNLLAVVALRRRWLEGRRVRRRWPSG